MFRALIQKEIGPRYIVPIDHLHRADGLSFSKLFLAMTHVLLRFLSTRESDVYKRQGQRQGLDKLIIR